MDIMNNPLVERFLTYVKVDTQSNEESQTTPSTEKQYNLLNLLKDELTSIGMEEITLDENGYLFATLPANTDKNVPTIGFLAHVDTATDFTGANVKPQIVDNYDGGDIVLNKALNIILSPKDFPELEGF